jgi:hypothetical protein
MHKLTSSQAHKLTSSQAHIAIMRVALVAVASIVVAFQSGCGPFSDASGESFAKSPSNEQLSTPTPVEIDAGIIFADEANYLCIPLSRIGIADSEEVNSVKSSCECSVPSIVQYYESGGRAARSLRMDFTPDPHAGAPALSNPVPSNIAVAVTIHLRGGRTSYTAIRFLRTTRVPGAGS